MQHRRHSFRPFDPKRSSGTLSRPSSEPPIVELTPVSPGSGAIPTPRSGMPNLRHDLACGILAGIIEAPNVVVTPDAITTVDPATRAEQTEIGWRNDTDPLGRLANECHQARLRMTAPPPHQRAMPWEKARAVRTRDEAAAAYRDTRRRVFDLLKLRGVFPEAQRRGFRVMIDG